VAALIATVPIIATDTDASDVRWRNVDLENGQLAIVQPFAWRTRQANREEYKDRQGPPPAGNGTTIVIGRVGNDCACTMRDRSEAAAALAPKRKRLRRGNFIRFASRY
jgi:hypothetical protein